MHLWPVESPAYPIIVRGWLQGGASQSSRASGLTEIWPMKVSARILAATLLQFQPAARGLRNQDSNNRRTASSANVVRKLAINSASLAQRYTVLRRP